MVEVQVSRKISMGILIGTIILFIVCLIGVVAMLSYSPFIDPANSIDIAGTISRTETKSDSFDIELNEYENRVFRVTNLFFDVFSFSDAKADLESEKSVYLKVVKSHFEASQKTVNIRELRTTETVYLDAATYQKINEDNITEGIIILSCFGGISLIVAIGTFIFRKNFKRTLFVESQDLFINYCRPHETLREYHKRISNKKLAVVTLSFAGVSLISFILLIFNLATSNNLLLYISVAVGIVLATIVFSFNHQKIQKEEIAKYCRLYQFKAREEFTSKYGDDKNYFRFTETSLELSAIEMPPQDGNTPSPNYEEIAPTVTHYPYADLVFELKTRYNRIGEIIIVFILISCKTDENIKSLLFLDENLYSIIKHYHIDVPNLDGFLKNIDFNIKTNIKRIRTFMIKGYSNLPFTYVKNKSEKYD